MLPDINMGLSFRFLEKDPEAFRVGMRLPLASLRK
jgi:hypothetical protein